MGPGPPLGTSAQAPGRDLTFDALPVSAPGLSVGQLDATSIKATKQRFLRINRERVRRVRETLPPAQRDFLDLLPLLFHTNHPLLPGFVSKSAPFGVSEYTPETATLAAARRLTRSFEFRRRAVRIVDIHSLLLMGSGGSVAYSRDSDFDIWVCHRPDLDRAGRSELLRKTDSISEWAHSLGLEVHFFNLSADTFRSGKIEALSSESSGSTQHYLLLDEFYRTGLLLAGRYPVWWLVPPELERCYHEVVEAIRTRRLVAEREYLDFGPVSDLPASEFVGAALWHLTKAIASPHKSLLKIMLLEAYATDYPEPDLLSVRYKRAVYGGERSLDALDPYVMFERLVEDHLRTAADRDRLELARECFYLKVNVPLSRLGLGGPEDWRTALVRDIVKEWGWDRHKLAQLDARSTWKIDQVMEERAVVVRALTHAYRLITRFARERTDSTRVSERDMTILGRKLFAAFEHKAGKIEIVSRGFDSDLAEPQLTVVRTPSRNGPDIWSVYRGAPGAASGQGSGRPLRRAGALLELLTWCYFNGVLSRSTRVSVQQADVQVTARDIETLEAHLRAHFPSELTRVPDVEELARPPDLLVASTFVNLGIDPMANYTRQGKRLTSNHVDALSYGGLHENLIREIDYLVITTWREVLTLRYQGIQGLLECLAEHLGRTPGGEVSSIPCLCFTPGYAHAISRRVTRLFEDVATWFRADPALEHKLYVLKGGDHFYVMCCDKGQVSTDYVGPLPELTRYLGRPRESYTAVTMDPFALANSPLELVYRTSRPGKVSCNYQVADGSAQLFIVDEHGALFHERMAFHSDATLVRHLREFFEAVQLRQSAVDLDRGERRPLKISFHRIVRGSDHTYRLRPVQEDSMLPANMGLNVRVIGERVDGETQFTLYCDEREFSTLEHGENVFEALAEHILRRRAGRDRYPIYINDIDLSRLEPDAGAGRRLQTIHYLHYKQRIEDQLNEIVLSE